MYSICGSAALSLLCICIILFLLKSQRWLFTYASMAQCSGLRFVVFLATLVVLHEAPVCSLSVLSVTHHALVVFPDGDARLVIVAAVLISAGSHFCGGAGAYAVGIGRVAKFA